MLGEINYCYSLPFPLNEDANVNKCLNCDAYGVPGTTCRHCGRAIIPANDYGFYAVGRNERGDIVQCLTEHCDPAIYEDVKDATCAIIEYHASLADRYETSILDWDAIPGDSYTLDEMRYLCALD